MSDRSHYPAAAPTVDAGSRPAVDITAVEFPLDRRSVIPARSSGSVYFVADITKDVITRVKIGYSLNPWDRWRQLERKYRDCDLNLFADIPGDRDYERALHKKFDAYALGGEWFSPSRAVVDFMYAADHFDNFHTPDLCAPHPCRQCRKLLRFYAEVVA